jgi:hypothetical protein
MTAAHLYQDLYVLPHTDVCLLCYVHSHPGTCLQRSSVRRQQLLICIASGLVVCRALAHLLRCAFALWCHYFCSVQASDRRQLPTCIKTCILRRMLTYLLCDVHSHHGTCCFAARKREMDDNSRRIGGLFWKLNEAQVAPHVVAKLLLMCAALDAGNWPAAQHLQVCVWCAFCLGLDSHNVKLLTALHDIVVAAYHWLVVTCCIQLYPAAHSHTFRSCAHLPYTGLASLLHRSCPHHACMPAALCLAG